MPKIVSKHQCENHGKISALVTLSRDIIHSGAMRSNNKSFIISVDFIKAYDSIDRQYFHEVMVRIYIYILRHIN